MTDETKRESLFERMSRLALEARRPKMQLFHKIEGACAIIRDGVYYRQVDLYARGDRVFIKLSRGFCRIVCKFGKEYGTANPNVKVVEYDAPEVTDVRGELKYKA